ncbi:hypothetical protein AVEN_65325-1 [Araneus ventricosus]|uniref:Uncharacterized protein n=1 Tax=Araneus ventricosus TaxID=182803 RepID=A0A4Y2AGP7_ARAVE|nr:hypothetical protein AVEN_65325-1 [Araneus ventricosus]
MIYIQKSSDGSKSSDISELTSSLVWILASRSEATRGLFWDGHRNFGVYSGTPGWVGFRTLTTEPNPTPNPTGGTRMDPFESRSDDKDDA